MALKGFKKAGPLLLGCHSMGSCVGDEMERLRARQQLAEQSRPSCLYSQERDGTRAASLEEAQACGVHCCSPLCMEVPTPLRQSLAYLKERLHVY